MTATQEARRGNPGILTGSLFVVLWFAGTIVQGLSGAGFPRPTDDMATVAGFMRDGADRMEQSAGLQILSGVALLWFAAILATHLRRHGRPGSTADLALAGGVAASVTLMASAGATVALGSTDLVTDDASAQLLYQLSFWLGGPLHVAALGTMILAAARGLVLPTWLGVVGLIVGGAGVLAALSPIVAPMVMFTPVGRFLGFFWIIGVTVLLVLRPARAPAEEEARV